MGKRFFVALVALGAAITITAPGAQAATNIDGQCADHIGKLLMRNQTGSWYGFRWGRQRSGVHCYGRVRVNRIGRTGTQQAHTSVLVPYNMRGFSEHNVILITSGTVTVIGCKGVAKGFIAALEAATAAESDGLASIGIDSAASVVGCGLGARTLFNFLPNGPKTVKHVHLIK